MFKVKVLNKDDVIKVLEMQEVINVVENVYRSKNNNETEVWPTVFYDFSKGKADMDIKSGYLKSEKLFGHKTVTWFGDNIEKGIPTLIGMLVVFDATTGAPIGIMDASYITGIRTGAAGAIGAKYLAKKDADSLLIIGAGNQSIFQVAAMLTVLPNIKIVRVASLNFKESKEFIDALPKRLENEFGINTKNIKFEPVRDLESIVKKSEIIITVTPSRKPIIKKEWVKPGTHISCIGADMEGKQEIESDIMTSAIIYVDDLEHCKQVGEIEKPIKQGVITEDKIIGEIGELIAERKLGRTDDNQITIYDATGMAILDIATAKKALQLADEKGFGTVVTI